MHLLITGALWKDPPFFKKLENLGHVISYVSNECIPLMEQGIDPSRFEGVICNGLFLYTPIEQFSNLRWIQLTSAGYDRMPMDYIHSHKIDIRNACNVYSIPMAEFILCGVLQLYKQSRFFAANQAKHKWEKHRNLLELGGKTVCIVGCGNVGTECAKRFKAMGCRVIGINRHICDDGTYHKIVGLDQLNKMLPYADVIILSIALSSETFHLFKREQFSIMKSDTVFVNISRGEIVDTAALIAALPYIGGAVLDVFENEPLTESKLWDMENVIITPHNSFCGEYNALRLQQLILERLKEKPCSL